MTDNVEPSAEKKRAGVRRRFAFIKKAFLRPGTWKVAIAILKYTLQVINVILTVISMVQ